MIDFMKKSLITSFVVAFTNTVLAGNIRSFKPGEIWLDTKGSPINAHSGGFLYHQGKYYWYGEIKTGKTWLPDCNISWDGMRVEVTGISCYSSKDLYNWTFEGNVLPAVKDDPAHDLHTSKILERPKVIYNKKTKKFVMWMHIDSIDYNTAHSGVAVSEKPTGPFKYLGSIRPNAGIWPENVTESDKAATDKRLASDFHGGQHARDMTLFVDDDGKAYHFYASEQNTSMHVSELTEDYLKPSGRYKRILIDRGLEAPAVFKRNGKYYLFGSFCTGWDPNPASLAVADSIWGPWKYLGDPCIGDSSGTTFRSQSTYVLPVQGKKDAYIFMADRWNKKDLPDSRYVWLPVQFNGDKPQLKWIDKWDLSFFK